MAKKELVKPVVGDIVFHRSNPESLGIVRWIGGVHKDYVNWCGVQWTDGASYKDRRATIHDWHELGITKSKKEQALNG